MRYVVKEMYDQLSFHGHVGGRVIAKMGHGIGLQVGIKSGWGQVWNRGVILCPSKAGGMSLRVEGCKLRINGFNMKECELLRKLFK